MQDNPLVSICCITYNHELYIAQAIEGFLIQKINFPIEIIIHDDSSTDRTAQIVKQYADKHPHLINPIFQNENQYSKYGGGIYARFVYPKARGKYIAICDGDDYWIDSCKLQKQVDFLESHDDYVLCAGKSLKIDGNHFQDFRPSKTGTITFKDIAHHNFIVTNTLVFRNIFRNAESRTISNYLQYALNGDIFLFLSLLMQGKGYILQDCIGAYRMHDGGIISKKPDSEKYLRSLKTRNTLISYLKGIKADDQYIKDVEYGYLLMFESYLNNNKLTEEFMEIVPKPILNTAINKLINNYQRQLDSLNNKISQSNDKEMSRPASSVECLVAERDAALVAVAAIKHSTSWRLTAPLRLLGYLARGVFFAVCRLITYIKKRMSDKVV